MEQALPAASTSRRDEDIALDLLKFVVTTTGTGRSGASTPGFVPSGASKPDDHLEQLLGLYSRCLKAVKGKGDSR